MSYEVPLQCRPLCPFSGMDLLAKCLVATRNCRGPSIVEPGTEVVSQVELLPNGQAVTREAKDFILEPELACTNTGINTTIDEQLKATRTEQ